jgi:hypothetical protein
MAKESGMAKDTDDPIYWRSRAAEALAMADQLTDADAKAAMRTVASSYETIAKITERLAS